MSRRLGYYRTALGIHILHYGRKKRRFTTTYTWLDERGRTHKPEPVPHLPESAYRHYELCRQRGVVLAEFPLDGES